MTDPATILLQFWGKTPKQGQPPEQFHPAVFHMLDVAFVAETLLRDGAPRLKRALLHAWRGCDPDALIAWLPFLIATHDLGKISAAFQGQVEPQRERLERADAKVRFTSHKVNLYHAEVSALWLHLFLQQREPGVASALLWALRDAMGGHHGRFTQDGMRDIQKRQVATERGEPRWGIWREQTYALLRERLAPAGDMTTLGAPQQIRAATAALTGFIIWCDWMGSNEHDFPACPSLTTDAYMVEGRRRTEKALKDHALRHARSAPGYISFNAIFPEVSTPRPLQVLIDQLSTDQLFGPLLAVIEAPTGEGKTEAALALARRIAAGSEIDEIFFALPTMATGNQMFKRLNRFYNQLYGEAGAVKLTHSQAAAVEDELRRAALSNDSDSFDPEGRSADAALEWFVGPKKAMLAPFGVGTVDQVELAGLNVRHYALRLFGLAGKVVVIDEIHAYDAYMTTILGHTLSWLAGLGCSVVLLSATLPAGRHRELAAAFLAGLNQPAPPALPADLAYPALSLYRAGGQLRETCAVFRGEQRFTLRLAQQRATPEDEARYLLDLVRGGGALARLCNRVDDAQAIYAALKDALPAGDSVLLHARFPLDGRQERERSIERMVGKETTRGPGDTLIIVGTQVLEQSLDYDVDVMVSDFAPIDLLLQRAGRLHRHDRSGKRPLRHLAPVLEVTLPYDAESLPDWDRWKMIYDPYILWRSLATLEQGAADGVREIVLPRDYRPLIEAVYADDGAAEGAYAEQIARARTKYLREVAEHQAKGRVPLTPEVVSNDAITEDGGRAFIDDESGQAASGQLAKTRLGDRVTLVPVYRIDGRLYLDADGTWEIDRDIRPDPKEQKELLAHAVPVSDRRVIAAYRDEKRDRELRWPWPERGMPPLLRSLQPLPLNRSTNSITIQGRTLRLDTDLGLVIEKADPRSGSIIEEDL